MELPFVASSREDGDGSGTAFFASRRAMNPGSRDSLSYSRGWLFDMAGVEVAAAVGEPVGSRVAGGQHEAPRGTQDPVELAQSGDAVADIVDDQGGEDEVHCFVGNPVERFVEVVLTHVGAGAETSTGVADHVGALVEPSHLGAVCDQLGQVEAGPSAGVQCSTWLHQQTLSSPAPNHPLCAT